MMRSCISGGPFVVALLKLALDLFHRIEPDTDDDENRGAAEREVLINVQEDERDRGQQRDQSEIQGAGKVSRDSTKLR
jgi:hypothetical protein